MYGGEPYADASYADVANSGHIAQSTVVLPMFTGVGHGKAKVAGAGTPSLPMFTIAAFGISHVRAEGHPSLPMFTIAASGIARATARGHVILPGLQGLIRIKTEGRAPLRSWQACPRPTSGFTMCPTIGSLRTGEPNP